MGNAVEQLFYGRTMVHAAAAYYSFYKGGSVRQMVHRLKYGGRQDIGQFAGRLIGEELKRHERFAGIQAVVPVPLHVSRQRKRGYNQAACIAEGISEASAIPHFPEVLVRRYASETQTDKSRFGRSGNVSGLFEVSSLHQAEGLHVLLVDDVITTGATLIACAEALLHAGCKRISVVAMAAATR
jgi:ComF family protein